MNFTMKSHYLCPLTHSLLAAGYCRFCESPIVNGAVAPDAKVPVSEVVQWNITAVLAALAADGDTPSNAVAALTCHRGDLFEELPIWRVALDHRDDSVRRMPESLLRRRKRDFQATDAERCERHLRAHPDEFALRLALLGFYFCRSDKFPAERAARQAHVLWVIQHRPGSEVAGSPDCYLAPTEGEAYEEAKALWLRHADAPNVSATILGNAARFFILNESDQSERLYQRAKQLEPQNSAWPEALGNLYGLRNARRQPNERGPNATRALEQFECALRLSESDLDRGTLLIGISKAAFEAGEHVRARSAAEDLFQISSRESNPADLSCMPPIQSSVGWH